MSEGNDLVDTEAMIFTEADVYMIAGYLSVVWSEGAQMDEMAEHVGEAIKAILADA